MEDPSRPGCRDSSTMRSIFWEWTSWKPTTFCSRWRSMVAIGTKVYCCLNLMLGDRNRNDHSELPYLSCISSIFHWVWWNRMCKTTSFAWKPISPEVRIAAYHRIAIFFVISSCCFRIGFPVLCCFLPLLAFQKPVFPPIASFLIQPFLPSFFWLFLQVHLSFSSTPHQ